MKLAAKTFGNEEGIQDHKVFEGKINGNSQIPTNMRASCSAFVYVGCQYVRQSMFLFFVLCVCFFDFCFLFCFLCNQI